MSFSDVEMYFITSLREKLTFIILSLTFYWNGLKGYGCVTLCC